MTAPGSGTVRALCVTAVNPDLQSLVCHSISHSLFFSLLLSFYNHLRPILRKKKATSLPHLLLSDTIMANTAAWTGEDVRLSAIREDGFPVCGYLRGSYLGQGGYARVYKVLRTETGQVCAGKTSPDAVKHLRKEARILRGLDHVSLTIPLPLDVMESY